MGLSRADVLQLCTTNTLQIRQQGEALDETNQGLDGNWVVRRRTDGVDIREGASQRSAGVDGFVIGKRTDDDGGAKAMIFPALVEKLIVLAQPFADLYADNKILSLGTTTLHIGGLLAGGGLAIATDRAVLRMQSQDGVGQRLLLDELASTHTLVISAIAVLMISGLMFLAADVKTFLTSPIYWIKMSGVLLLLLNGLRLWRAEGRLQRSAPKFAATGAMPADEWRTVRSGAITSLVLWFAVMVLGVVIEGS